MNILRLAFNKYIKQLKDAGVQASQIPPICDVNDTLFLAYLKNIKNTISQYKKHSEGGSIVTFNALPNTNIENLLIGIEPVQSGSGDPSPDNVRPISGWTGCNVTVSPTLDAEDDTTYRITFPTEAGTVYGGTLDVTTGVLTVTHKYLSEDGTKNWVRNADSSFYSTGWRFSDYDLSNNGCCNYCRFAYSASLNFVHVWLRNSNDGMVNFQGGEIGTTYPDVASLKAAFAATPLQIVYPIAEPQTYQLTPLEIKAITGINNIFADTGNIISFDYYGI